jgi:uncharacterized protein YbjT (DUF2867 family)
VLLSARRVEFLPGGAVGRAEQALRDGPLPWTILRPTHFAQNFTEAMFVPRDGLITAPVGAGREPFADVADVAEVVAAVLAGGGHDGATLGLSGPESISFPEAAQVLAQVSGAPVRFADKPDAEHAARPGGTVGPVHTGLGVTVRWRLAGPGTVARASFEELAG